MPPLTLQTNYADIRSLVKDLKDLLAAAPGTSLVEFTGAYAEGVPLGGQQAFMTLSLTQAPQAIELVRCTNTRAPGVTTGHGTAVEWAWTPAGARVLRIEGLTPGTSTYSFLFRVTW